MAAKKKLPDFRRAAAQRLSAADRLMESDNPEHYLDAIYLGGYVVECALKALLLHGTPKAKQSALFEKISQGSKGHDFDRLAGMLRDQGRRMPLETVGHLRAVAAIWQPGLRYEVGQRVRDAARAFLNAAGQVRAWVERSW